MIDKLSYIKACLCSGFMMDILWPAFSQLDFSEKIIIDNIIKNFGCYSGKILERFTHEEKPWRKTRANIPEGQFSEEIVKKDLIKEYFLEVKEKIK